MSLTNKIYSGVAQSKKSNGIYSNVSDLVSFSQGINLRVEMSWLCNNTGYFIGWRNFNLSKRSTYWDVIAKEAIGGPPWEYTDYVFKGRRVIPGRTTLESEILARFGEIDRESLVYFIPYNVGVKEEDLLFRIYDETTRTIPTTVRVRKSYEITLVEPKIDGDLIYTVVKVKVFASKNDNTLRGYIPATYIPV